MGLFSGLGRGLAAGALGAQKGQIAGEAEGYKRQQAGLLAEYRKQALIAHQKTNDPDTLTRKLAGQMALHLVKIRSDLEAQGFFKAHPEMVEQYDGGITHAIGVNNGTIPADQFDPVHYGRIVKGAHEAVGQEPPSPFADVAPPPGSQPGGSPAVLPGAGPYEAGAARGPLSPGALAPPPMPPPPPVDTSMAPVQAYETPKQLAARLTSTAARDNAATAGTVGTSRVENLNLDAAGKRIDLTTRAKKNATGIQRTRAGTAQANEAVRSSQALTPVKAAKGKSDIQHQRVTEGQGDRRIGETERHNRSAEEVARLNANTNAARQKDTASYHGALMEAGKWRMNNFPATERGRNLRAKLAADVKGLSATMGLPGGIKISAAAGKADQWAADMDKTLKAMDGEDQKNTKTGGSISYSGQARNAPPLLGLGKAPAFSPEELDHVGKIIKSNTFDQWMASPALKDPALRAKAKAAYLAKTKRAWAGK